MIGLDSGARSRMCSMKLDTVPGDLWQSEESSVNRPQRIWSLLSQGIYLCTRSHWSWCCTKDTRWWRCPRVICRPDRKWYGSRYNRDERHRCTQECLTHWKNFPNLWEVSPPWAREICYQSIHGTMIWWALSWPKRKIWKSKYHNIQTQIL